MSSPSRLSRGIGAERRPVGLSWREERLSLYAPEFLWFAAPCSPGTALGSFLRRRHGAVRKRTSLALGRVWRLPCRLLAPSSGSSREGAGSRRRDRPRSTRARSRATTILMSRRSSARRSRCSRVDTGPTTRSRDASLRGQALPVIATHMVQPLMTMARLRPRPEAIAASSLHPSSPPARGRAAVAALRRVRRGCRDRASRARRPPWEDSRSDAHGTGTNMSRSASTGGGPSDVEKALRTRPSIYRLVPAVDLCKPSVQFETLFTSTMNARPRPLRRTHPLHVARTMVSRIRGRKPPLLHNGDALLRSTLSGRSDRSGRVEDRRIAWRGRSSRVRR